MQKKKKYSGIYLVAILLVIFSAPFIFLSYILFFAWDSQQSGEFYKPAVEIDGKLYEVNMTGTSLAFDGSKSENHLYLNTMSDLSKLTAISYGDYEVKKTDNPFFAGAIAPKNNEYYEQETKYRNPKDSYQAYKFYDQNRNLIFAYEPELQSEFLIKLRPTFPAFSKRKYGIGSKRDYLNATKLLKVKLNKNLKIRIDEANKLLIFWFENL
jgi:hypothetical protein